MLWRRCPDVHRWELWSKQVFREPSIPERLQQEECEKPESLESLDDAAPRANGCMSVWGQFGAAGRVRQGRWCLSSRRNAPSCSRFFCYGPGCPALSVAAGCRCCIPDCGDPQYHVWRGRRKREEVSDEKSQRFPDGTCHFFSTRRAARFSGTCLRMTPMLS